MNIHGLHLFIVMYIDLVLDLPEAYMLTPLLVIINTELNAKCPC